MSACRLCEIHFDSLALVAEGAAAGVALGVLFYSLSDGSGGHVLLQVGLLLAGAVLVFEGLALIEHLLE